MLSSPVHGPASTLVVANISESESRRECKPLKTISFRRHYLGATYYGIGSALARIVNVILHGARAVMTVCAPTQLSAGVSSVTLSLPRLVGGTGVLQTFPLPLSTEEDVRLSESAMIIRRALDELEI